MQTLRIVGQEHNDLQTQFLAPAHATCLKGVVIAAADSDCGKLTACLAEDSRAARIEEDIA